MEVPSTSLSVASPPPPPPPKPSSIPADPRPNLCFHRRSSRNYSRTKPPLRIRAVEGAVDLPPPDLTWQIAVGALAGVTPFVVAGIEFGKRIMRITAEQRRCGMCSGSGLVLRNKKYRRCPGCGGFLPWQSWKRFFTG